jgi:hypothetical protein
MRNLQSEVGNKAQSELLRVDELVNDFPGDLTSTTDYGDPIAPPLYSALTRRVETMFEEVKEYTKQLDQPNKGVDQVRSSIDWIEARDFRLFNPEGLESSTRRSQRGLKMASTVVKKAMYSLSKME